MDLKTVFTATSSAYMVELFKYPLFITVNDFITPQSFGMGCQAIIAIAAILKMYLDHKNGTKNLPKL